LPASPELASAVEADIDEMRFGDLIEVVALERASFTDPWNLGAFVNEFLNRESGRLVARPTGASASGIAGYAVYALAGDELHVNNIAVRSALRGRGIGRLLVAEVLRRGEARGASTAWLEVRPSNAAALALYEGLGFEHAGRRRAYYASNGEDAIVLRRPMGPVRAASSGMESLM